MDNSIVFLILGIVIGFAGALIGVGVVLSLRSGRSDEAPSSKTAPTDDESIRLIPLTPGEWMLEVRGGRYRQLSEVRGAVVTQRVQSALGWLAQFAAGQPLAAPPPASRPSQPGGVPAPPRPVVTPPAPPPAPVMPPPIAAPEAKSAEEEFLQALQASSSQPTQPASSLGLFSLGGKKAGSDLYESPDTLGIVSQIEKALQRRLERLPDLRAQRIHVSSAPDGSLRVEVGGRFYSGVDQVPDRAVRDVLQAAIKDWEAGI